MKKTITLLLLILSFFVNAQFAGDIAQNFGGFPGPTNAVNSIITQADGKILVGGAFTSYNETTINRLIRLNIDGSYDTSFNTGTGFSGSILAITIQSDGKILVGGGFITYNGTTSNRIIRLNTDGSIDTTFNTGIGFNNIVKVIATQVDGKILIGGDFTSYDGVTENKIIRLNTDGSKDTTFNTGTGFNSTVTSISSQNDGKILVSGAFTLYNGTTENRLIRLNADGSKDTTFNVGIGFNNGVTTMLLQNDGKILFGGAFTSYKGIIENCIIRLNTDGTKDTTFNIGAGFNTTVMSIATQSDGKIIVGGNFTSFNGTTSNRIIRLNSDGTNDISFNIGTGFNDSVLTIAIQTDGKILAGGSLFTTYNGETQYRIIRLNANGNKDTTFYIGTGFNNTINSFKIQTDGKILVGGAFTYYNGATENRIIRLNADGSKDTTFITNIAFNGIVTSIAIQNDGKILVGGAFTSYKGEIENRIIRLNADGSKDITFNTGTGFNNTVNTILLQTDGKILIGGQFTSYNGSTENYIIRLNTDGSKDNSFNSGSGFDNSVFTISTQNDNKILIGGDFGWYNGATTGSKIIRLNSDGTKDTNFNSGSGFNNVVNVIYLQTNGQILVGGAFTSYNGITGNKIIRLNTDGSVDTNFNTGTGFDNPLPVNTITTQSDGKILVGGAFSLFNGLVENRIIRLNNDGSKDNLFITGTGFNNSISSILILPNGNLLIGGSFINYNGIGSSAYLIALYSNNVLNTQSFKNQKIIFSPNPTQSQITFEQEVSGLEIFDVSGKKVKSFTNTKTTFDVSDLQKGIYFLKGKTKEGNGFNEKLIKE